MILNSCIGFLWGYAVTPPSGGEKEIEKFSEERLKRVRSEGWGVGDFGARLRERVLAQCRVGVCSYLRGYVGFGENFSSNCKHCGLESEDVPHFWERCPKWERERAVRAGTEEMVCAADSARRYIAITVLSSRLEGLRV